MHELYSHFAEGIELLNDSFIFLLIGAVLPWDKWTFEPLHFGSLLLLGVLVMLFRRLPGVILLYKFIPGIESFSEAVLVGHFGPIGVGAFFVSFTSSKRRAKDPV